MNLDINEDWRLRSDKRCIILEQRIVRTRKSDSKDGEHKKGERYEKWVPSFHATVRQALRKFYDEGLRDVDGVEELRAAVDRLEAAIEKVPDKLGAG